MNRQPNHGMHINVDKRQYDAQSVWNFENQWRTELFDCKPVGRCCFACCFPCCFGCKLAKYLGEPSIVGCCPGSLSYFRTKLRTARRIEGSCCGDCCATNWCGACVAVQMANELESQGLWDVPKTRKVQPRQDRFNHGNNPDY